jgi:hypothetical protein
MPEIKVGQIIAINYIYVALFIDGGPAICL